MSAETRTSSLVVTRTTGADDLSVRAGRPRVHGRTARVYIHNDDHGRGGGNGWMVWNAQQCNVTKTPYVLYNAPVPVFIPVSDVRRDDDEITVTVTAKWRTNVPVYYALQ